MCDLQLQVQKPRLSFGLSDSQYCVHVNKCSQSRSRGSVGEIPSLLPLLPYLSLPTQPPK